MNELCRFLREPLRQGSTKVVTSALFLLKKYSVSTDSIFAIQSEGPSFLQAVGKEGITNQMRALDRLDWPRGRI